jgi:hypothetical protein
MRKSASAVRPDVALQCRPLRHCALPLLALAIALVSASAGDAHATRGSRYCHHRLVWRAGRAAQGGQGLLRRAGGERAGPAEGVLPLADGRACWSPTWAAGTPRPDGCCCSVQGPEATTCAPAQRGWTAPTACRRGRTVRSGRSRPHPAGEPGTPPPTVPR